MGRDVRVGIRDGNENLGASEKGARIVHELCLYLCICQICLKEMTFDVGNEKRGGCCMEMKKMTMKCKKISYSNTKDAFLQY